MKIRVTPVRRLAGHIEVPGDKSISHRAALFGALAHGRTEIRGYLEGEDCLNTLKAIRLLGVEVTRKAPGHYLVDAAGLEALDGAGRRHRLRQLRNGGAPPARRPGRAAVLVGDDGGRVAQAPPHGESR